MKTFLHHLSFIVSFLCLAFGAQAQQPAKDDSVSMALKSRANRVVADTVSNFSIKIDGPQNLVAIKTDSLKLQTTKSLPNNTKANNTIDINGQGNTVAISQEDKNNKVVISQNGNNNSVKIVQSGHQP